MKRLSLVVTLMLLFGLGLLAVAQTAQQTAPKVKVGSNLTAKANTPMPSTTAKNTAQKASVGKAKPW